MEIEDLRVGQLVVLSIRIGGFCTLNGDPSGDSKKWFRIWRDEYVIGEVVGLDSNGLDSTLKVLTGCGVAHIPITTWARECLSIRVLTETIGEWLGENCSYNHLEGKHRFKTELLATGS